MRNLFKVILRHVALSRIFPPRYTTEQYLFVDQFPLCATSLKFASEQEDIITAESLTRIRLEIWCEVAQVGEISDDNCCGDRHHQICLIHI